MFDGITFDYQRIRLGVGARPIITGWPSQRNESQEVLKAGLVAFEDVAVDLRVAVAVTDQQGLREGKDEKLTLTYLEKYVVYA